MGRVQGDRKRSISCGWAANRVATKFFKIGEKQSQYRRGELPHYLDLKHEALGGYLRGRDPDSTWGIVQLSCKDNAGVLYNHYRAIFDDRAGISARSNVWRAVPGSSEGKRTTKILISIEYEALLTESCFSTRCAHNIRATVHNLDCYHS